MLPHTAAGVAHVEEPNMVMAKARPCSKRLKSQAEIASERADKKFKVRDSEFNVNFCLCDASLATHEDGICPVATKNPSAADERLLESLLGRRRLLEMERMGGIPFIRI
ncbi:MAG: hypothetical protein JOS17DRAFT_790215 [Linnemannia elongata]|nr:MAG: hypothetical protein JOS17DRAFT_790215 [Linnemannia elongata]